MMFIVVMTTIFLIDLLWLTTVGRLGLQVAEKIQRSPVRFRVIPAIIVYIALAYLLIQSKSFLNAVLVGACTYIVYDFTSLAILEKYDWRLAVADGVWGGVLFGIAWKILSYFGWLNTQS